MKQATLIVILALCIGFLIWLPFQFPGKPAPVAIDAGQARGAGGVISIDNNQFQGPPNTPKFGIILPMSDLIIKGASDGPAELPESVYEHRIKQKKHRSHRPKLAWKPGSVKLTSVTDFLYTDPAGQPRLSIGQMTIPVNKCPAHDRSDHQVIVFQRANGDKLTMCMEEFIDKTTKILELEGATVRYTAAPKKENKQ